MLIIGIGNMLRGDDAVGSMVTDLLLARENFSATILNLSGQGAELMDAWAGEDTVILIDAVSSGKQPGTVLRLDASTEAIPAEMFGYSSHSFGLAGSLEIARALGNLPKRIVVYGIEGDQFSFGEEVSESVQHAAEEVADRIAKEVTSFI